MHLEISEIKLSINDSEGLKLGELFTAFSIQHTIFLQSIFFSIFTISFEWCLLFSLNDTIAINILYHTENIRFEWCLLSSPNDTPTINILYQIERISSEWCLLLSHNYTPAINILYQKKK